MKNDLFLLRAVLDRATNDSWQAAARPSHIIGWPVVTPKGRPICNIAHLPNNILSKEAADFNQSAAGNAAFISTFDPPMVRQMVEFISSFITESQEFLDSNGEMILSGTRGHLETMIKRASAALAIPDPPKAGDVQ